MKKIILITLLLGTLLNNTTANAANKGLNSKQNKSACSYIKAKYNWSATHNWSKGIGSEADFIKESDSNIRILSNKVVLSNGKIQKEIKNLLFAENKTKESLLNKDIEGMMAATSLKISSISKFDKLCNSINK
jgi:hypothetical protein